jgi:RNA polymerase sigma factor (sigma-70 family)
LFSILYIPVRSQARGLCLDRGDAEDLTQVSLLTVFQKLSQLRDRSRLLPWTRAVVRTAHLMSLRRSTFAPPRGEETILYNLEIAGRGKAPDNILETQEVVDSTLARVLCLSPCLRDVVELRIFQNKNTAQAAHRLHISRAAVRTRLKRAREALRPST